MKCTNLKHSKKNTFNPPLAPLAGARFSILQSLERKYHIEPEFKWKWRKTKLVSFISTAFAKIDTQISKKSVDNIEIKEDPIFIIGHWRSGTTLLHNMLCLGDKMAYTTTYQSVFPNNLFFFQFLFKTLMRWLMPSERPADGVKIDPDYPQEEEIGLGNEIEFSFYYWFYFPLETKTFMNKYLIPSDKHSMERWKSNYLRFIKKSIKNTGGQRFISKNPPNTLRIQVLLEVFPNAKFIFIHRNPYEVFLSSKRFFWQTINGIKFQTINETLFDANTFSVYAKFMDQYKVDKGRIPEANLLEIRYKDLLENPLDNYKNVIQQFHIGQDETPLKVNEYIKKNAHHQVQKYDFSPDLIDSVNRHWGTYFDDLGYEKLNP